MEISSSPLDPGPNWERWLAHRMVPIVSVAAVIASAGCIGLMLDWAPAAIAGLAGLTAILAVQAGNHVHQMRIRRGAKKLCSGCADLQTVPDDINAEIANHDRGLRTYHAMYVNHHGRTVLADFVMLAAAVGLNRLMPGTYDIYMAAWFLYCAFEARVVFTHWRLFPWCPYCEGRWGEEGEHEPSPDPQAVTGPRPD